MKTIEISKSGTTAVKIEIHDPELNVVVLDLLDCGVHEQDRTVKGEWEQPEIKPHQFEERTYYYVECTPEQRAEIIRIAQEYGREIYKDTPNSGDSHPNLDFWGKVGGTYSTPEDYPHRNWIPFDEFVARLKGEWTEVTEAHAHIAIDAATNGEYTGGTDYSHLIGKWVKYVHNGRIEIDNCFTYGKWYKCMNNPNDAKAFIDDEGDPNGYWHLNKNYFDLTNPRDTNPDEPVKVHEVVTPKQIKPHQFEAGKDYFVECTPGQRAEIIRIAEEYRLRVYWSTPNSGDDYPNLVFCGYVWGTCSTPKDYPHRNWIPFDEFVARLKGEWVEPQPEQEVHIPFDASRMAEAIRFETRDGFEVRSVVVNDIEIIRYITGFPDGFSNALTWDKNGRHNQHEESILDLFMVVKEVRND